MRRLGLVSVLVFSGACDGGGGGGQGGALCVPGQQVACACPGGTQGVQVCADDGQSLGTCQCGSGGAAGTGGGGAAGMAGAGGAGSCTPNEMVACYDGPRTTMGVGVCKAGIAVCQLDGMSLGPCVGEVLPSTEDCATPEDEDCDGNIPACTSWLSTFGVDQGSFQTVPQVLGLDSAGNAFVAGLFSGSVTFAGSTVFATGSGDIFVLKLAADGTEEWIRTLSSPSAKEVLGLAVDSNGRVAVAGRFDDTPLDVAGAAVLTSAGAADAYLVVFDGAGTLAWAKRFGGVSTDSFWSIGFDGGDHLRAFGRTEGASFGGLPLPAGQVYAEYDSGGAHVDSKSYPMTGGNAYGRMVVSPDGSSLITGLFSGAGSIDLGGGVLLSSPGGGGTYRTFYASLDANGTGQWGGVLEGPGDVATNAVLADAAGGLVLGGYYAQNPDLGPGPPFPPAFSPGGTAWLARADDTGVQWALPFPGGGASTLRGLSWAADGSILAVGNFSDAIDFGSGSQASNGPNGFVARVGVAMGADAGSFTFGTPADDERPYCIATAPDGTIVLAGTYFTGGWDSGGGILPIGASAQAAKGFVFRRALP